MCSVVGCGSWRRRTQRFRLPEDPEKRLEWVQFLASVNKQRFKESSWTDITICGEHFKADCFENPSPDHLCVAGGVQLKPSAVPSVCPRSEQDEPEPIVETPECVVNAQGGPVSKGVSCSETKVFISAYGQMKPIHVNSDLIREKATLLKMKDKHVVNEKRLLQLFSSKCPSCGSKLEMEKVTYGVLLILNQQCLQCEYRNQWQSQVSDRVPTDEEQHLAGATEIIPEAEPTDDAHFSDTGVPETVAGIDEENDPIDETEETSDQSDMDSEEEWKPVNNLFSARVLQKKPKEKYQDAGEGEYEYYPSHTPRYTKYSQLCTECGMFFGRRWPHTCEHKIKPFSCNICGKRCVSEIALNTHSRIHDDKYEHRCKYCHVTFRTKVDKTTHEQIHFTDGKPYKCPDCSETFASNKERRIHLEDHRGPKQLKCHICGIEFLWPLALQRHLTVHTGEKPFKCLVCQRGFNQASHLKSHMRLHTGERPYKCQHCDKCFNHNVSLKSHVQRYHSASSGGDQEKEKLNERASESGNSHDNGNKRGTDSDLDDLDEEQDTSEEDTIYSPKKKRRSTGRPIGRPKNFASGSLVLAIQVGGPGTNPKTQKLLKQKMKSAQCSNEESEDGPSDSDMTSMQEENTSKLAVRAKSSDGDCDFDPEYSRKKTKNSSHNSGKITRKRRGRPRKCSGVKIL
ncbi:Zinc finger protein 813 [Channa argus]|uniref:Zinc finger protein 813 n=1 Tax=Channa argus TaxID=215402 RepID=A0A6G1Q9X3_CHAAH|nr:Zinc finger protein 813 [Channa argus]